MVRLWLGKLYKTCNLAEGKGGTPASTDILLKESPRQDANFFVSCFGLFWSLGTSVRDVSSISSLGMPVFA
jgi:hypothetical protein